MASKLRPRRSRLSCSGPAIREGESSLGTFRLLSDGIEITPGPESYHSPEPARITIHDGQVDQISSKGADLSAYELEPQLVTALFDAGAALETRTRKV